MDWVRAATVSQLNIPRRVQVRQSGIVRGLILGECNGIRVYEMNHTVGLVDLGVAQTDLDGDRVIDPVSGESRSKYRIPIYLKQPSSWPPPLTSQNPSANARRFAQHILGFCYWSEAPIHADPKICADLRKDPRRLPHPGGAS